MISTIVMGWSLKKTCLERTLKLEYGSSMDPSTNVETEPSNESWAPDQARVDPRLGSITRITL